MSVKISGLPAGSALTGTESFPDVQSGTTVKSTAQDIKNFAAGVSWNHQTGTSYTAALTDDTNGIRADNASANTVTIVKQATTAWRFPGSVIYLTQWGAGQSSFLAGSGVTLNNASSLNCRTQYSLIFAVATDVTDTWVVAGDMA